MRDGTFEEEEEEGLLIDLYLIDEVKKQDCDPISQ